MPSPTFQLHMSKPWFSRRTTRTFGFAEVRFSNSRWSRHGLGGVAIDNRIFAIAGATGPSARGTTGGVEVYAPAA